MGRQRVSKGKIIQKKDQKVIGNYSPHKKVKKSLTGFGVPKIEMTLLQLIVLFIGMPRSLQRIFRGVMDFASKNRF